MVTLPSLGLLSGPNRDGPGAWIEMGKRMHQAGNELWHVGTTGGLRGSKGQTYEGGPRVPAILRWPGKIEAGRVSAELVGMPDIYRTLVSVASGKLPDVNHLLAPEEIVVLKRLLHSRKHAELPPIVTHHVVNDQTDPVLTHLRHRQLFNNEHDRVKIVFHPEFINRTNPLFAMDYPEFVRGCHLGVFPSYYEPWGYTPAECAVMGVPAVCTDLSGFGAFMEANVLDHEENGIYVLRRRNVDVGESIDQLADIMIKFTALNRRQRIQLRNRVERLSQCLDWNELNPAYEEARELALQRAYPPKGKTRAVKR